MASFAPIRGTQSVIDSTPIIDGQVLFQTDAAPDGKIYFDNVDTRIPIGGGVSVLSGLSDTDIVSPTSGEILQYNGTSWANTNALDGWVSDSYGNVIEKTLPQASTEVTFTATELSYVIANNFSVDPYVECDVGYAPPNLVNMIWDEFDNLTITYTEVTAEQSGASDLMCKLKLRIVK